MASLLLGQHWILREGCGCLNEWPHLERSLLACLAEQQMLGVWHLDHQPDPELGEQGHQGSGGYQAQHEAVILEPACERDTQLDASWDTLAAELCQRALCSLLWLFLAFCGAL